MAVPRVFISSTYYDLKEVRNNIGNFVMNLGYEPIMHERSSVAYTQDKPLEEDCYHELASCDIVVCVIGNKFGSQSLKNDLSVTMNEIQSAVKHKKKVYIFISKDVYIENRTYEQNKGNGAFKSAYTDDLRIHEFIMDLRTKIKVHFISAFDTTDEIISMLKAQFAGLFQNLLARESSVTDAKTVADLNHTATDMKEIIETMRTEAELFFKKFDSTALSRNFVLHRIENFLGIQKAALFARDIDALDEIMEVMGFSLIEDQDEFDVMRKYEKYTQNKKQVLTLKFELCNDDGTFKDIRVTDILDRNITWTETDISWDLPF